jgi:hypothetical protein
MEKNQPNYEELIRFRSEAAALLGVRRRTDRGSHEQDRIAVRVVPVWRGSRGSLENDSKQSGG